MTELEELTAILDDHGLLDYHRSLGEAVRELAATAAQAEQVRAPLAERALLVDAPDIVAAVCDAVAWTEWLPAGKRDLADSGRRYAEFSDGPYRERRWCVNLAGIARRVILRAHGHAHTGEVSCCSMCAPDWTVDEDASGVRAPGC